jgi:hypothetical protein
MKKRRYSRRFRQDAVLPVYAGRSIQSAADQLGMPPSTLGHWVRVPHSSLLPSWEIDLSPSAAMCDSGLVPDSKIRQWQGAISP